MHLIDQTAAVAAIRDLQLEPDTTQYIYSSDAIDAVKKQPAVDAVPLDRLCQWLETNCILSCVSCEHLFGGQWCKQHPELPYRCHRKEHWKDALTKWMDEQDAAD